MPEGDTVYRAARALNDALAGRTLTRCDIRVPAFATVDLTGERVHDVVSRGKHILIRVGTSTIHSHLKMDGEWRVFPPGAPWRKPAHLARIVLGTAAGTVVGFELGILEVLPTAREADAVGHLGPDLLDPDWAHAAGSGRREASAGRAGGEGHAEAERRLARQPDMPIAVALLDQRNLAGLGNEYVAELCFLRGMLPTRPVRDADLPRTVALAHRLIMANRDRVVRTTTGDSRRGRTTWVYGRGGEPCRRCGTSIVTGRLGADELTLRETYHCPHCQT